MTIKTNHLQWAVETFYGLETDILIKPGRGKKPTVRPKHLVMLLARDLGKRTTTIIARDLNCGDHSTASNGVKRARAFLMHDEVAARCNAVCRELARDIEIAFGSDSEAALDRITQRLIAARGGWSPPKPRRPAVVAEEPKIPIAPSPGWHMRVILVPSTTRCHQPKRPKALPSDLAPPSMARLMGGRA